VRVGIVSGLWRFPVKSLGGERARHVFVGPYGITGDRTHALVGADGGVLTARRTSAMLGFRARHEDPEGATGLRVTCPDGRTLAPDDPALAEAVGAALGRPATMARSPVGVFDAAPLHLVTDASLRQVDEWLGEELDVARFRANVVVELEDPRPFAEGAWVGRRLALGAQVVADVVSPTERCAVPTFDPDTLERDPRVLATLARRRDNLFGVYAGVARPGWLRVGDPVELLPQDPAGG
jgi:uncharacterized protein YcbX